MEGLLLGVVHEFFGEVSLESFESHHHNCYIIQSFLVESQSHYILDG